MKYFEVLVISNESNSHYEGRFFMKALSRKSAVDEVKNFLEVTNECGFKFYTRELNEKDFYISLHQSSIRNKTTRKLIEDYTSSPVDSLPFNKISSTNLQMDLIDLRDIG